LEAGSWGGARTPREGTRPVVFGMGFVLKAGKRDTQTPY